MLTDVAALGLALFAIWAAQRPATPQRDVRLPPDGNPGRAGQRRDPGRHRHPDLRGGLSALVQPPCGEGRPDAGRRLRRSRRQPRFAVDPARGRNESLNVRGAWLTRSPTRWLRASHRGRSADQRVRVELGGPARLGAHRRARHRVSWGCSGSRSACFMEGVPTHLKLDEVTEAMAGVAGVVAVHDLHVWTITSVSWRSRRTSSSSPRARRTFCGRYGRAARPLRNRPLHDPGRAPSGRHGLPVPPPRAEAQREQGARGREGTKHNARPSHPAGRPR